MKIMKPTHIIALAGLGLAPHALAQDQESGPTTSDAPANSVEIEIETDEENSDDGLGVEPPEFAAEEPIAERIAESTGFTKLQTLIEAAEMNERLASEGPITLFAPTDVAFRDISEARFEELLQPENRARLITMLEMHLVDGRVLAAELETGEMPTVSGRTVTVKDIGDRITLEDANLTMADMPASNGVIHAIDQLLTDKSE